MSTWRTALVWLLATALLVGAATGDLAPACLGAPGAWIDSPLTEAASAICETARSPLPAAPVEVSHTRAPPSGC